MLIIIQISFVGINVGIAMYQAHRFDHDQKRINHMLWAIYYCLLLVPVWFWQHNLALVMACGIQHLPVFNTALNLIRHKPFFYTHPEDPQGSKLDKLWGKYYPVVFFLSLAALVAIQFFI